MLNSIAFEHAPIGIFIVDKNDNFVQFNHAMEAISGLSSNDVIGSNLLNDLPRHTLEGEANFKQFYQDTKVSLKKRTLKSVPIITPVGKLSYQTLTLTPIVRNGNIFDGMVVYVEEVSDVLQKENILFDEIQHAKELKLFHGENVPVVAFRWSVEEGWPVEMVSDNISQYGYDIDDFISGRLTYSDIVHPEDLEKLAEHTGHLKLESGKYLFTEYRILDSSGNSVWVNEISFIELDENGNPSHYNGIIFNITDRLLAEQSLTKEREYLNSITSNLGVGLCIISPDYRTIWMNNYLKSLYGEIEGKLCYVSYNNKSEICEDCAVRELMETGKTKAICEQKGVDINGKTIWSHIVAIPLYDNDGNVASYMEMVVPVTEMKLAEMQVREGKARIESILRATPVGMGIVSNRVFEEVNNRLCDMLGYSQEDLVGKSTRVIYPSDEDYEYVGREKYAQMSKMDYGSVETRLLCSNGTVIDVILSSSPIYSEYLSKDITFTVLDITELKNTQRELEKYAAELEKLNQIKNLFSDIIRHDLLGPAGVVGGYAEVLKDMESDISKLEILDIIEENNDNIVRLIETAAKYEKINSLEEIDFHDDDIVEIFKDVVEDLKHATKSKNMFVNVLSDGPCCSKVNSIISEAFVNLLSNAIKYSPEDEIIDIGFNDDGAYWKVTVTDRGDGIPDDAKKYVFDRFKRVDKKGVKGTGLGLAIVKRIMELHGGDYGVMDNQEGKGSVFWVTLKKI